PAGRGLSEAQAFVRLLWTGPAEVPHQLRPGHLIPRTATPGAFGVQATITGLTLETVRLACGPVAAPHAVRVLPGPPHLPRRATGYPAGDGVQGPDLTREGTVDHSDPGV